MRLTHNMIASHGVSYSKEETADEQEEEFEHPAG
jgi:hypothetical protein